MTVGTGGTLNMTIDSANNSDDYDFTIWGPFTAATAGANCPPVSAPIRCSYSANTNLTGMMTPYNGQTSSIGCGFLWLQPCTGLITSTNNPVDNSEGAGGDSWVNQLTVTAGQVYIMLIDNFSNSGQPYNLSWGGSAVLNCNPVVLPITLTNFTGHHENRINQLKWETAAEINNDYFTVTRSTDGVLWEPIASIDGTGSSQNTLQYSYNDHNFENTSNYYRIAQTDFDGTISKSDIVLIDNSLGLKTIQTITNLMGQEVDLYYSGLKIILYADGTVVKSM